MYIDCTVTQINDLDAKWFEISISVQMAKLHFHVFQAHDQYIDNTLYYKNGLFFTFHFCRPPTGFVQFLPKSIKYKIYRMLAAMPLHCVWLKGTHQFHK